MTITTHAVASLVITTNLERLRFWREWKDQKKWLIPTVCLSSLISHFVLDSIPHYDYSIREARMLTNILKLSVDSSVMLAVFLVIFWGRIKFLLEKENLPFLSVSVAGIFFSLFPDVIIVLSNYFYMPRAGIISRFDSFHAFLHSAKRPDMTTGVLTQIVFCSFLTLVLKVSAKKLDRETITPRT